MLRIRTLIHAFPIALAISLVGCAIAPSVGIEDPNATIPEDAGIVAVQVVNNSEQLSEFLNSWTAIFLVEERPGAEALYLSTLDSADLGTDVFVGALAPGTYRLLILQAYRQVGDFTYRLRAPIPRFIGHFAVESGRLTNLGTLIAQPLEEVKTDAGLRRRFTLTRSDKPARMREFIHERLPEREGLLTSTDELGWLPDELGLLRNAVLDLLHEKGLPRGAVEIDGPGDLLAYGRLGQIYFRRAGGQWVRQSLPGELEIYSATRMHDGRVALGGERGTFYISSPPYQDFTARPLPSSPGPVYALLEAEPGILIAVVLDRDHLSIMTTADLGATWIPEKRIVRKKPGFIFGKISLPTVARLPDGTVIVRLDGAKYERRPGRPEWLQAKGEDFTRFVAQRNGIWVGVPYDWFSGEGFPVYSSDKGGTWIKTAIRPRVLSPARGTPYVFADFSIVQPETSQRYVPLMGWKKLDTVALSISADNGKTLQPHGSVPWGCDRIRGDISYDHLLFLLCQDGRLMRSEDGGKNFTLEFDPTLTWADVQATILRLAPDLGEAPP